MDQISSSTQAPVDRRRRRLRRSIAQAQLLVSAAMLLLACSALFIDPSMITLPPFFGGLSIMFVVTAIAVLVPWTEETARLAVLLPLFDIVAIVAVREGSPTLGAGIFLVFPVIWMSRHNRLWGAVTGVVVATALIWIGVMTRDHPPTTADFGGLILLPTALAFIATTTFATGRRTASQRILLQQQASLVEAEFARARRQERFRNEVLDAVRFGVIAFDRTGNLTLMNEAHRTMLAEYGAPAGAVLHPVVYEIDRVTPFSEESHPLARALSRESFDDVTIWVGDPGSHRAAFAATSHSLTTPDGEYDGQVVVLRDITRELNAIDARDDLVASVSHDLRTPITSILGYLELVLEDDELNEPNRKMVEIAHRNSERLLSLVADLMHAASESDSSPPMAFQPYDLSFTVDEAVTSQRPMIEGQGLRLETQIDAPALTVADPLRMRQVLDNLLTNAVKYNSKHGTVRVVLHDEGDTISLAVSDTGVGISAADQVRLFERFYRTDSARQSSVHGTGLGLHITSEIINQHGGEIIVTSEPGAGSTFEIRLPSLRRPAATSSPSPRSDP